MKLLTVLSLLYLADCVLGYWTPLVAGEEGKCGCCPKPCCCHCIQNEIPQTTTTTTPATTTTPEITCEDKLDLAFIMDESGSIGSEDWEVAKQFVADVVEAFAIGENATLVGMVTYSNNATVRWNFKDEVTKNLVSLLEAIMGMDMYGGFTNTPEALYAANTYVFNTEGDRYWPYNSSEIANVVVVMTDGRANFRLREYEALAEALKETATVVVIGITDKINMTELEMIASDPSYIYTVNDFFDLQNILNDIKTTVCTSPIIKTRPTKPIPTQLPVYSEEECFCCCPPPPAASYGYNLNRCHC